MPEALTTEQQLGRLTLNTLLWLIFVLLAIATVFLVLKFFVFRAPLGKIIIQSPARTDKTAKLNEDFVVRGGETATILSENLRIKFTRVIDDSRCPDNENTVCEWIGQAVVAINVIQGGKDYGNFEIASYAGNMGKNDVNVTTTAGIYNIKFARIEPLRKLDRKLKLIELKLEDYLLSLRVSKVI